MTKHNIQYIVDNKELLFPTSDVGLSVLDDDKNVLGTFRDLFVRGTDIESVNFKTIKTTGVYNVKNLIGIPETIPGDKISILSVTAIGNPKDPDLVFYRIICENGVISENVVSKTNESGWGNGGKTLEDTINSIKQNIQENHQSTTASIDVLSKGILRLDSNYDDLNQRFTTHNHDTQYLFKDGDVVKGDLIFEYSRQIYLTNKSGKQITFARLNDQNELGIGSQDVDRISLQAQNGLYVNGNRVYTSANAGEGSGIDADKLDGLDSSQFAQLNQKNKFTNDLEISNADLVLQMGKKLTFKNESSTVSANIIAATDGTLLFRNGMNGENTRFEIDGVGTLWSHGSLYFDSNNENQISFRRNDYGVGFARRSWQKQVMVYNWIDNKEVASFGTGTSGECMTINESPYIRGRRLFLQDNQPSGDIPYGSIWIGF